MKAHPLPVPAWLLFVVLASCTRAPDPTGISKPTGTITPAQAMRPTQAAVPADLAFAAPLVDSLRRSGLSIQSVQSSKFVSMFPSTDKAAWIKTDQGVVDVVFFIDPAEAGRIHITPSTDKTPARYIYIIQAAPPTLLNDQTIDAAFPLYFTVARGMFMVTSSADLDKTLKRIFPGG